MTRRHLSLLCTLLAIALPACTTSPAADPPAAPDPPAAAIPDDSSRWLTNDSTSQPRVPGVRAYILRVYNSSDKPVLADIAFEYCPASPFRNVLLPPKRSTTLYPYPITLSGNQPPRMTILRAHYQ